MFTSTQKCCLHPSTPFDFIAHMHTYIGNSTEKCKSNSFLSMRIRRSETIVKLKKWPFAICHSEYVVFFGCIFNKRCVRVCVCFVWWWRITTFEHNEIKTNSFLINISLRIYFSFSVLWLVVGRCRFVALLQRTLRILSLNHHKTRRDETRRNGVKISMNRDNFWENF